MTLDLEGSRPIAPHVTAVIACFNGAQFIEEAINSVLWQRGVSVEVVIVDDGSTDDSVAVIEGFRTDARVRLVRHEENQGIASARNTGIRASCGRYIGFLDQDDVWLQSKLEQQVAVFEKDKAREIGMVFGVEETRDYETGGLVRQRIRPPKRFNDLSRLGVVESLLLGNYIPTVTALFRRACFDSVGYMDEQLGSGVDDFDLFLRVAMHNRLHYIDSPHGVRRIHGDNYTKLHRMVPELLEILDRTVVGLPAVRRVASRARSHYLYLLARESDIANDHRAAMRSYRQSIAASPTNWSAYAALLLCASGLSKFRH